MTREEFADMVAGLVREGKLSLVGAAQLRQKLDLGEIAEGSMPLPWRLLPGPLTKEEYKEALRAAAAFITPKEGKRLLATGDRPRITSTPPEVKALLRERLRNHFRGDYEATMAKYAKGLAQGGNVKGWHATQIREQRAYIARMMTAGVGRALAQPEMDEVNKLAARQNHFLQRFASEISARNNLGKPFSEAYLRARSNLYGGVGWATWFKGNEIVEGQGDGKLIRYEAVDDPRTCSPCHEAELNGPYLPGSPGIPYPGEVCLGHGHCRCRHVIYYDMAKWRELKGLPDKPSKPPKTEEEKEAQRKRIADKRSLRLAKKAQEERAREEARLQKLVEEEAAREAEKAKVRREALIKKANSLSIWGTKDKTDEEIETLILEQETRLAEWADRDRRMKPIQDAVNRFDIGIHRPIEEIERLVEEFLPVEKELNRKAKLANSGKGEVEFIRPAYFDALDEIEGLPPKGSEEWETIIKGIIDPFGGGKELRSLKTVLDDWIQTRKLPAVSINTHGMTDTQDMVGVLVDEVEIRWPLDVGAYPSALRSMLYWYAEDKVGRGIPQATWEVTRVIHFTDQGNKHDADSAKRYGMPNFVSLATGGDGNVMVYSKNLLDPASLTHEGAHNLATVLYGGTSPLSDRKRESTDWDYMRRHFQETAVRKYGTLNGAEDFATAFEMYQNDKEGMKKNFPNRFEAVELILKGGGEKDARKSGLGELIRSQLRATKAKQKAIELETSLQAEIARKREEFRLKREAEAARLKAIEEEAERKRLERKRIQEEAERREREEEERRKREEAARLAREEEARQREEAARKAQEEEARRRATVEPPTNPLREANKGKLLEKVTRESGTLPDSLKKALRLIEESHTIPFLSPLTIEVSSKQGPGQFGGSQNGSYSFWQNKVWLNKDLPDYQLIGTAVHELGHMLEDQRLTNLLLDLSESRPSLTKKDTAERKERQQAALALRAAFDNSEAYKELQREANTPNRAKYNKYLLLDKELWARAYMQYVATKTGDIDLKKVVETSQIGTNRSSQWNDKDFKPILEAVDKVLKAYKLDTFDDVAPPKKPVVTKEEEKARKEEEKARKAKEKADEKELKVIKKEALKRGFILEDTATLEDYRKAIADDDQWRKDLEERIDKMNQEEAERLDRERREKVEGADREREEILRTTKLDLTLGKRVAAAVEAPFKELLKRRATFEADLEMVTKAIRHIDTELNTTVRRLSGEEREQAERTLLNQRFNLLLESEAIQSRRFSVGQKSYEVLLPHITLPLVSRSKITLKGKEDWELRVKEGEITQQQMDDAWEKAEKAKTFLELITHETDMEIVFEFGYKRAGAGNGSISISPDDFVDTIVHELAHNIEYQRGPEWRKKRIAFYEKRTKGEELQKLRDLTGEDYGDGELAKPDKFLTPYMGRLYDYDSPDHSASEIITMGAEYLWNDPATFLRDDPEYFHFIVGYLGGKL